MSKTALQFDNSHDILESEKEKANRKKAQWLQPWRYKKGQSGNPSGKPKGAVSMKTYVRNMLATMDDKERQAFLHGIDKTSIWQMGEGTPQTNVDVTTKGESINDNDKVKELESKFNTFIKGNSPSNPTP